MNLGLTIKNKRKDLGLTQQEFASKCDITQTYLSQIENNNKEPNLSTLKVISYNLGIPLPILFYLSISIEDVSLNKRKEFEMLNAPVQKLINDVFYEQ